jgi:hypothetical protein
MPDEEHKTQVNELKKIKLINALWLPIQKFSLWRRRVLDTGQIYDKLVKFSRELDLIRRSSMSLQSHLVELERRHQALEREIHTEQIHPSASDLKLRELKRKKLHLKQEIERLKGQTVAPVLH